MFLRIGWIHRSSDNGESLESIERYMADIDSAGNSGRIDTYRVVDGGRITKRIHERMEAGETMTIIDRDRYALEPTHLVVAELPTLDDATELESRLKETRGSQSPTIVAEGVYKVVSSTHGRSISAIESGVPAPIIQLGTFNMPSAEHEFAIHEWYRTRRLPSFASIPGSIRARRMAAVCGAPARIGVIYEFTSLEARMEHFEPLEGQDHDEERPSAASYTQHPPFSSRIGVHELRHAHQRTSADSVAGA